KVKSIFSRKRSTHLPRLKRWKRSFSRFLTDSPWSSGLRLPHRRSPPLSTPFRLCLFFLLPFWPRNCLLAKKAKLEPIPIPNSFSPHSLSLSRRESPVREISSGIVFYRHHLRSSPLSPLLDHTFCSSIPSLTPLLSKPLFMLESIKVG
ncbi:unnamed protein product, partial [Linum tenue]